MLIQIHEKLKLILKCLARHGKKYFNNFWLGVVKKGGSSIKYGTHKMTCFDPLPQAHTVPLTVRDH